jgi:hypothetical protein
MIRAPGWVEGGSSKCRCGRRCQEFNGLVCDGGRRALNNGAVGMQSDDLASMARQAAYLCRARRGKNPRLAAGFYILYVAQQRRWRSLTTQR